MILPYLGCWPYSAIMSSPSEKHISPPAQTDHDGSSPESSDEQGDSELSFEALGRTFAELIQADESGSEKAASGDDSTSTNETGDETEAPTDDLSAGASFEAIDDACAVSPRSILEAVLFVGHAENHPITSRQAAALMRGVSPREIDELVVELNAEYDSQQHPYRIESVGAGYRLVIRDAFFGLRDKLHGRVREARLSQAAIDVLAIVAYNQPTTRDRVEQLRGKACGGILAQLIRRQLLQLERPEDRREKPRYRTTPRFLQIFGLETLQDLPQSQDVDRVM